MMPKPARFLMPVLLLTAACAAQEADRATEPTEPSGKGAQPVAGRSETVVPSQVPSRFTNLQVLPEQITKQELMRTMKRISRSLGAKCDHCHRTDTRDFASDELEHKRVAREMLQMVDRLNLELFTWEAAPEATCYMCHRGEHEPVLTLAEVLDAEATAP